MLSGRWQSRVLTKQDDPSRTQPVVWGRLIIAYLGRGKKNHIFIQPRKHHVQSFRHEIANDKTSEVDATRKWSAAGRRRLFY